MNKIRLRMRGVSSISRFNKFDYEYSVSEGVTSRLKSPTAYLVTIRA